MRASVRWALPVLAWVVCVAALTGCGKAGEPVDTGPFENAVHAYLKANSMALKVAEVKEIKVDGDTAEASISLEHAEGMVGAKVRWKFWFAKQGEQWTVTKHKQ